LLFTNPTCTATLREEHGRRVKAEDDVANLKRALSLVGPGGGSRLAGFGGGGGGGGSRLVGFAGGFGGGGGRLDDLAVLQEMNRAAMVIQRRGCTS
jgi:uncharacterized membrane protein